MTALANRLLERFYAGRPHPYRLFEEHVGRLLAERTGQTLLDAGCGRTVPVLRKYRGVAARLIGVELVEFTDVPDDIEAYNADLAHLPLRRRAAGGACWSVVWPVRWPPVRSSSKTPDMIFTASGSWRWVVKRDWPGRRLSRKPWISASVSSSSPYRKPGRE